MLLGTHRFAERLVFPVELHTAELYSIIARAS